MKTQILVVTLLTLTAGAIMAPISRYGTFLPRFTREFQQPPKQEAFALLEKEIKKRNLRYEIVFIGDVASESFEARARHIEAPEAAVYLDQGRRDEWVARSGSESAAAYALYLALQQPPTNPRESFARPN